VLVLESVWGDELSDTTSVRPFLEGWARALELRVAFRTFHDARDLGVWLAELFARQSYPSVCYIAGHGQGGRLSGVVGEDINLMGVLRKADPPRRRRVPPPQASRKGILLGACETGSPQRRRRLLDATGAQLSWIAGYEREVPWLEATLCDLLFLTYLFEGRVKQDESSVNKGPVFVCDKDDDFMTRGSRSAQTLATWVREDFPVAKAAGFGATDRTPRKR